MTLTDVEKDKITAEEIFRSEIRSSLEGKTRENQRALRFLNSPFGIYLLSTVLVGLVSFSYTQWKEKHDLALAHHEQLEKIQSEVSFRVRQMDAALNEANENIQRASKDPEPDAEALPNARKTLDISLERIPVVVKLGGLLDLPGDLPPNSWVRYRDTEVQPNLLPFNQGYRSKDYAYESLPDLIHDAARLRDGKAQDDLSVELARLEDPAYQLVHFTAFTEATEYGSHPMDNMHQLAERYQALLKPVADAWAGVKNNSELRATLDVER